MRKPTLLMAVAALATGLAAALPAPAETWYTINGQPASYEAQQFMAANGLPPGHYWLDANGYWGVIGDPQPYGNLHEGSYVSRYGSGEQSSNGWSHYDNLNNFSVGGDANGCLYAGDWSNC